MASGELFDTLYTGHACLLDIMSPTAYLMCPSFASGHLITSVTCADNAAGNFWSLLLSGIMLGCVAKCEQIYNLRYGGSDCRGPQTMPTNYAHSTSYTSRFRPSCHFKSTRKGNINVRRSIEQCMFVTVIDRMPGITTYAIYITQITQNTRR